MMRISASLLLAFLVGSAAGALVMYIATGFLGPPAFARMRFLAALLAMLPGLTVLGWAAYRYFAERYVSYGVYDLVRVSTVLLVLLPLVMWLGYPYLHERLGVVSGGWQWVCSAGGCEWRQGARTPDAPPVPAREQRRR